MLLLQVAILVQAFVGVNGGGDNINAVEFSHMCAAFNLATATPELPWGNDEKKKNPVEEAREAIEELRTIELTFSRKEIFDSVDGDAAYEKICADEECKKEVSLEKWNLFKELKKKLKNKETTESEPGIQIKRPESEKIRSRLSRQLRPGLRRATELENKITSLQSKIEEQRNEAIKFLRTAAFGTAAVASTESAKAKLEELKEAVNEAFLDNDPRNNACGAAGGSATHVGMSIVSDIVCLCTKKSTPQSTDNKLCGPTIAHNSGYADSASQAQHGLKLWGNLKTDCTKTTGKLSYGPPSPAAIREAITTFRGDLGKGYHLAGTAVTDDPKKSNGRFILGTYSVMTGGSGAPKCDGTVPTSAYEKGVCVDYSSKLSKGEEIPWVAALNQAGRSLETMEKQYREARHLIDRLHNLVFAIQLNFNAAENSPPMDGTNTIKPGVADPGTENPSASYGATQERPGHAKGDNSRVHKVRWLLMFWIFF